MRQNLGSGICLTQCRAIGRPRLSGMVGVRKAWVGVGMDGVGDRDWEGEGVRDRVYGIGCMGWCKGYG